MPGMSPPGGAELRRRAARARALLRPCVVCARRCGADRLAGDGPPAAAFCGLGGQTRCYRCLLSLSEELELLPSLMVYFAGCNLRCRFCTQAPASIAAGQGEPVEPASLAAWLAAAVAGGARSINLVGGEPSLQLHTLLELALAAADRPLPLVLNSNMYMSPGSLELLDGVVALYLADLKFGNDDCAERLAAVPGYLATVTGNLLAVAARGGRLIVRHLLLPGHLDCCFVPVVQWLARNLPDVRFSLQAGYVPAGEAWQDEQLARTVSVVELAAAVRLAGELGLRQAPGEPLRRQAARPRAAGRWRWTRRRR
ncbi:MAG: radical SAM protein [Deltaproteobacteria bacterium]|nr:radical SAM protein [Deltaproteobacteria bacterium]